MGVSGNGDGGASGRREKEWPAGWVTVGVADTGRLWHCEGEWHAEQGYSEVELLDAAVGFLVSILRDRLGPSEGGRPAEGGRPLDGPPGLRVVPGGHPVGSALPSSPLLPSPPPRPPKRTRGGTRRAAEPKGTADQPGPSALLTGQIGPKSDPSEAG